MYNIYIRDVIKNETKYIGNEKIEMSVGIITGVNQASGEINNCLVRDSRILASFILYEEDKNIDIDVFAGGIAGKTDGGKLNACVYDTGKRGSIMSQGIILYENDYFDTENTLRVFSGGISGILLNGATVNKAYSYVRNVSAETNYRAVDAEYDILNKFAEPEVYYALRSGTAICDSEGTVFTNSYAYSADENIEFDSIKPTKNGNNREDKKSYTTMGGFSEKIINSAVDLNGLGLGTSFFADFSSGAVSHIAHMLMQKRKDYISIYIDKSERDMLNTFRIGETYTLKNLDVTRQIGQNEAEKIYVYKIKAKNAEGQLIFDKELNSTEINNYYVDVFLYGDEKATGKEYLSVLPNEIAGILVDDPLDDKYTIYYDEVDEYFENWNVDDVDIFMLMANGDKLPLAENDKKAITINTSKEDIAKGENYVNLEYRYGNFDFETNYVLNVNNRNVVSLEITKLPDVTEYTVGDEIDLSGMEVKVCYDAGDERLISGKSVADKFEVIGRVVPEGKSKVTISYQDYNSNNLTDFEVNGKPGKKPVSSTPETSVDVDEETIPTEVIASNEELTENSITADENKNGIIIVFVIAGVLAVTIVASMLYINHKKHTNMKKSDDGKEGILSENEHDSNVVK